MAQTAISDDTSRSSASIRLQTGAWYGDHPVELGLPESWDVSLFSPRTGPVLDEAEIDLLVRSRDYSSDPYSCTHVNRNVRVLRVYRSFANAIASLGLRIRFPLEKHLNRKMSWVIVDELCVVLA